MNKVKKQLPEDQIQLIESAADWIEAVEIASKPLLKKKMIAYTYVENMIKNVKDNGPYMVLADYFALMHAKPGEGVHQPSMSLLVTKEEVLMEGKPVRIFLVLAAKDHESHLESLQEVLTVFMDEKRYRAILEGSRETIIRFFERGGNEK